MKRLTDKRLALPPGVWQEVTREQRMEMQEIPVPSKQELYYRLFQIEEILCDGTDEYDLGRLRGLVEAKKDGRCVVLPCKRDDVLWTFHTYPSKRVYSFHVTDVSTLNGRTMLNTDIMGVVDARDVGKAAFLTRAEAEEALKAREQDD